KEFTEKATYSSPIVAEISGIRQYVQVTNRGIAGVAAKDGRLLWFYERKPSYGDVLIPSPLFHDDCIYATAGTGEGCDLLRLTAEGNDIKVTKVYANKTLINRQGGVVLVGKHLFG